MLESEIEFDFDSPKNLNDDKIEAMLKNKKAKKKIERAKDPKCTPIVLYASKKLQRKRFSWKRATVKILAVVMVGVASGFMLGNWYLNYLRGLVFDYSNYNVEDYELNSSQVLASILGITAQSGQDFSGLTETLKQKGMTPKDLSASQNFALANYNASLAKTYSAIGLGNVRVELFGGIDQPITSSKKFDGKTYTFESLSDGMLPVAKCAVMENGEGSVTIYDGGRPKKVEGQEIFTADWQETGTPTSLKDYVEKNGMEPSRLLPYIISSHTIIDENKVVVDETTWKDQKAFEFTLDLDPIFSVLRYYKQVMQTSGLDAPPTFDNVQLKIILDENWNFVRCEAVEHYSIVYKVMQVSCTGTLDIDFVFNQPVELPIGGAQ